MTTRARHDGFADWYDANIGPFAEPAAQELLACWDLAQVAASTWPAGPASICSA